MHRQPLFDVQDLNKLHGLIRDHALGTLIIQTQTGPYVDHLPFQLDTSGDGAGVLRTHVARDNPFWSVVPDGLLCTVVFSGPNAYISPSWYPSRTKHGRVQPSWYYSVVHATGGIRLVHDAESLARSIRSMTDYFEGDRPQAWRVDEAPGHFIDALVPHIIGVDIEISELVGKWQVGQQRNQADRMGIVEALRRTQQTAEARLADTMLAAVTPR